MNLKNARRNSSFDVIKKKPNNSAILVKTPPPPSPLEIDRTIQNKTCPVLILIIFRLVSVQERKEREIKNAYVLNQKLFIAWE